MENGNVWHYDTNTQGFQWNTNICFGYREHEKSKSFQQFFSSRTLNTHICSSPIINGNKCSQFSKLLETVFEVSMEFWTSMKQHENSSLCPIECEFIMRDYSDNTKFGAPNLATWKKWYTFSSPNRQMTWIMRLFINHQCYPPIKQSSS